MPHHTQVVKCGINRFIQRCQCSWLQELRFHLARICLLLKGYYYKTTHIEQLHTSSLSLQNFIFKVDISQYEGNSRVLSLQKHESSLISFHQTQCGCRLNIIILSPLILYWLWYGHCALPAYRGLSSQSTPYCKHLTKCHTHTIPCLLRPRAVTGVDFFN